MPPGVVTMAVIEFRLVWVQRQKLRGEGGIGGAWISESRNDFEQALYVVAHERTHSTLANQRLPSKPESPYGYNKETHANREAMKVLQKYRDRR